MDAFIPREKFKLFRLVADCLRLISNLLCFDTKCLVFWQDPDSMLCFASLRSRFLCAASYCKVYSGIPWVEDNEASTMHRIPSGMLRQRYPFVVDSIITQKKFRSSAAPSTADGAIQSLCVLTRCVMLFANILLHVQRIELILIFLLLSCFGVSHQTLHRLALSSALSVVGFPGSRLSAASLGHQSMGDNESWVLRSDLWSLIVGVYG